MAGMTTLFLWSVGNYLYSRHWVQMLSRKNTWSTIPGTWDSRSTSNGAKSAPGWTPTWVRFGKKLSRLAVKVLEPIADVFVDCFGVGLHQPMPGPGDTLRPPTTVGYGLQPFG